MKKKDTNTSNKEFDRDREFAVVLENLHTDIKIIAEGQKTTQNKVDTMVEELGHQKEDIWTLKADVSIIKTDVRFIKDRMNQLEGRMNQLEGRTERIENVTLEIAKTTREIKESVADHTTRITRLEETAAK